MDMSIGKKKKTGCFRYINKGGEALSIRSSGESISVAARRVFVGTECLLTQILALQTLKRAGGS